MRPAWCTQQSMQTHLLSCIKCSISKRQSQTVPTSVGLAVGDVAGGVAVVSGVRCAMLLAWLSAMSRVAWLWAVVSGA
jgi:hypothetical protein